LAKLTKSENESLASKLLSVEKQLKVQLTANEQLSAKVTDVGAKSSLYYNKLEELEKSNEKLTGLLDQRTADVEQVNTSAKQLRSQLAQDSAKRAMLTEELSKAGTRERELKKALDVALAKYDKTEKQVDDHEKLISEVQEKSLKLSSEASDLKKKLAEVTANHKESAAALDKSNKSKVELQNTLSQLGIVNREYKEQLEKLVQDNTNLNKKYSAIFSDVDRFEKENAASRKDLQDKYNDMKAVLERSMGENKRLQTSIAKYRTDNSAKNKTLAKTMQEKSSIREVYITLYSKYDALKAKNNELRLKMLNMQQEVNKRDTQFEKLINENISLNEKYLKMRSILDKTDVDPKVENQ